MIVEAIFVVLGAFLGVFLSPLSAISIGIDLVSSIPVVMDFIEIIVYVLPFENFLPLIGIVFAIGLFKLVIAILTTIVDILPFA